MTNNRKYYRLDELKKFQFNKDLLLMEVTDFMCDSLKYAKDFSGALLKFFKHQDSPIIYSYMPDFTKMNMVKNFRHSVLMYSSNEEISSYRSTKTTHIPEILENYLELRKSNLCIAVEVNLSKDDVIARPPLVRYFFEDESVYYSINHEENNSEQIERFLSAADGSWISLILLTSSEGIELPANGGEIDQSSLDLLAKNTEKVLIGAFDGEGYVIWERKD